MAQPRAPRPPLTHFLCIPLATPASRPQLAASLAAFRADVAATPVVMMTGGGGPSNRNSGSSATNARTGVLPPSALRPVGTLHLTLGVMSLREGGEEGGEGTVKKACEILQTFAGSVSSSSADSKAKLPSVALRGLHAMQPPARASVLYAAPVDEGTGRPAGAGGDLLDLCERLRAAFSGLIVDDGRPLLLHATVVNTVYVKRRGGGGGGRGRGGGGRGGRLGGGKLTFDARELIDRYEDHLWMERVPVETVALCRMGAQPTEVDDDGDVVDAAYSVEAEVRI